MQGVQVCCLVGELYKKQLHDPDNHNGVWNSLAFPMIQWMLANLISGSSAFSKYSLYLWKFSVQVLLKLSLEDFELTSM